ncbi:MAG: hypothetical protein A3F09_03700 [Chlamydiae bacterium RIFCSPHIGHO2_12_FULL_49_11]|nr:MAG: hypothetical protein A3F09_03700 [Chlamydiae bacterium RIFCSPHIGHO2_12_FULL_49_11]
MVRKRQKRPPYPRKKAPRLTGIISLHKRGFGFVKVGPNKEIFIPPPMTGGAMHGEKVEVEIISRSERGPEGRVVKVDAKKNQVIVATVISAKNGKIDLFSPFLDDQREILLKKSDEPVSTGDRVALLILNRSGSTLTCKIHKILGSMYDPATDISAAMLQYGLMPRFPEKVVEEIEMLQEAEEAGRKDLTAQQTVTIDPKDAKDYDDAIYIERTSSGYLLFVHIADVSYYVKEGSFLDKEAFKRGNSTYFPGFVVPMLPEKLSNDLCSLKENVPRRAVTAEIACDREGRVHRTAFYRSMIRSAKRFSYEEAKEVLDGKRSDPNKPLLDLMHEVALKFKNLRRERGSVELSLKESRIECDKAGVPQHVTSVYYDITHQMIEEFMLKANEAVALEIEKKHPESIYRVHEEPAEQNMQEFFSYARMLGFHLSPKPSQEEIIALFSLAEQTPYIEDLALRYIRSMKMAVYATENIGHYGLSLSHYTHFTSPIRRYIDLVIHRLLLDNAKKHNLEKIADHTSTTERTSFKAEMYVISLKKLRLILATYEKDPKTVFPGRITKLGQHGVTFDLPDLGFDGFIDIGLLPGGSWYYDEKIFRLVNGRSKQRLNLGETISLRIQNISLLHEKIDWVWLDKSSS